METFTSHMLVSSRRMARLCLHRFDSNSTNSSQPRVLRPIRFSPLRASLDTTLLRLFSISERSPRKALHADLELEVAIPFGLFTRLARDAITNFCRVCDRVWSWRIKAERSQLPHGFPEQ